MQKNRPVPAGWLLWVGLLLLPCSALTAQEPAPNAPVPAAEEVSESKKAARDLVATLDFKRGDFKVAAADATLKVDEGFRYLEAADARRVLEELWGNPEDESVLGLVVPEQPSLLDEGSWAVVLTYSDDGHVDDEDAAKADYNEILAEMQKATGDSNPARKEAGYPTVDLIGWAAPPRYDAGAHKIHWAKELSFDGSPEHTLNYDIRVLGREGYLSLNAVADMKDMQAVEAGMQKILGFTGFDEGRRYADFDPKTDKLAAYGVAALVAGALAGKAGLFAKLGVLLLAGKKLLIPIGIGIAVLFRKYFNRDKSRDEMGA